jgi:uncharacterized membrane protein
VPDRLTLAALIVAGLSLLTGCGQSPISVYPVPPVKGGLIRIDISAMSSSSCRFFSYPSRSGRNVDYLVYKNSAGTARVTLDACRTCYRWRRGYRLEGEGLVCARCGTRFSLDGLAEGTGSCVLIKVPAAIEGDTLVISASDLEAGARYF